MSLSFCQIDNIYFVAKFSLLLSESSHIANLFGLKYQLFNGE